MMDPAQRYQLIFPSIIISIITISFYMMGNVFLMQQTLKPCIGGVTMEKEKIILSVKDLVIKFRLRGDILTAIREASLDL